jgi:tRNA pseudouridine32 synthase/23S rRNA pseudouridine746 synthase
MPENASTKSPLPLRDGIAPSYIWLPGGDWVTVFDFLLHRFPHVGEDVLRGRIARRELVDETGVPVDETTPFRQGRRIWYYREVAQEPTIPFEPDILHRDERLLVVDKPHFLPMIPAGRYLHETLLTRLRIRLDLPALSPVHRLDRETAGVVLLCIDPRYRGAYQTLFERREVNKRYEAIAPWCDKLTLPRVHRSRIEEGREFFTMQEVPGEPNSETRIELIERLGNLARYALEPHTGKKHQLRAHMAALGVPILNDPWYPYKQPDKGDDYSRPLPLRARSITFNDPVSGEHRQFDSRRALSATGGGA